MEGWISLHRKIIEWEWYTDSPTKALFIHLLLVANHKPKKHQGVMVLRGQRKTGRKALSVELGLSEQQIRTALEKLQSSKDVTIKTTKKYSIITITNYESYQTKQPTEQPSSNQVATTNNNVTMNNTTQPDGDLQIFDEILQITGGRILDPSPITKWLEAGADKETILHVVKTRNTPQLRSLKYFDGMIAEAIEYKKQPLTKGIENGTRKGRKTDAELIQGIMDSAS